MIKLRDKFLGCMYGLAIGDALGFPTEFFSLEQIKEKYGNKGVQDFEKIAGFKPGTYSDDTQMSLATARALIDSKTSNLEDIMGEISRQYVLWAKSPENNRAPGGACIRGALAMANGVSWKQSGDRDSKGCGAAMRTAPIGLYFHNDFPRLIEVAASASSCTHAHPTGIASGIGTAYLVALAIENNSPKDILKRTIDLSSQLDKDFANKLKQVQRVLSYESEEQALHELGEGWVGEEAVALGLYCFFKNPEDYQKTVLRAANTNGDSDSIACIAGAISGAYNGVQAIPQLWVRGVENSDLIKKISDDLYNKSNIPKPNQVYLFASSATDEAFGITQPENKKEQDYLLKKGARLFGRELGVSDVLVVDITKPNYLEEIESYLNIGNSRAVVLPSQNIGELQGIVNRLQNKGICVREITNIGFNEQYSR